MVVLEVRLKIKDAMLPLSEHNSRSDIVLHICFSEIVMMKNEVESL